MARRRAAGKGLSVAQLTRSLEEGRIAPVYLVSGEETFLRRKAIDAIIDAVTDGQDPALTIVRIDGATTGLADVLDEARSLPLFLAVEEGPSRVLVVRDPQATPADIELLEGYFANPVDATCVVFEAVKLDARQKFAKLLAQHATVVSCPPPDRETDVRRWIRQLAEARGFQIEADAVAYLLEMVGMDLERLSQELEKAALFAEVGGRLTARQLESLLGRSRDHSVFELTDALVEGRSAAAQIVLNRLLDDGEEPVRILAMVSWVVRQLLTAHDLASRGCPERELLQQLGGRWDQRKRVAEKARGCSADELEALLISCARSDAAVKTRRTTGGRGTLEVLCRRICAA